MVPPPHDFVTVDMRGLKAALAAQSQAERVSVSVVVRRAVARELNLRDEPWHQSVNHASGAQPSVVKLSIRMTCAEAEQLDGGARSAGLSRGAFLSQLLARVPAMSGGAGSRLDCIAALTASNAELSTLSRNVSQLTTLLGMGQVQAAREYRGMLDTLGNDVRAHLSLAAGVLAELRPPGASRMSRAPRQLRTSRHQGERNVSSA